MRLPVIFGALVALLAVSGCTSTSSVDDLGVPRPSMETTSAIVKAPRPVTMVATAPAAAPQDLSSGDVSSGDAIAAAPLANAYTETPKPALKPALPDAEAAPRAENAAFQVGRVHGPKFRDADPVSFGSLSPKKYPVHGIDVSRWQGNLNWVKLRAQGANFAYIKATDGGDHIDPMFRRNWQAAEAAGVRRGAYHFFYWCRTAGEQADWFIRNVPRSASALPPVIDVEWNHQSSCKKRPSRETVLKKMQVFMDKLEAHYGQRPVIYTAPDFYEDNLQGAFPNHSFWLRSTAAHPRKTYPGRKWLFWQYSGTGLTKSVSGHLDLNVFAGDTEAWNRWLSRATGVAQN